MLAYRHCRRLALVALLFGFAPVSVFGITVEEALRFVPVQNDVDYDRPSANELAKCTVGTEKIGEYDSWVVRGPVGEILRCFTDTNKDKSVDQWRYFSNGIESYRDIDSNYNGKADEFRWLGLSGTRWGKDSNEDGQIDIWKVISPEEVSAEIVNAIRDKDVRRFANILITESELESLGLSPEAEKNLADRRATAIRRFQRAVANQRAVDARAKWVHFSANRPGVLPAGTNGNRNDLYVYENVAAMLEKGQVAIGTLVKAGDQWRAVDIPMALLSEKEQAESTFLLTSVSMPAPPQAEEDSVDAETRQLVGQIEEIEKEIRSARKADRPRLYEGQISVLRELVGKAKSKKEQTSWIRQMAETISTAVQAGDFPKGRDQLEKLYRDLDSQAKGSDLTGFVRYRLLTCDYAVRLADPKADFPKIQEWWSSSLEEYLDEYGKSSDAVEAMLQLAMAEEFAGNDKPALKWYEKIVARGGEGIEARKAEGARRRISSVGKPLNFTGQGTNGRPLQTAQFKGKYVLVHYWATWCNPCMDDMEAIAKLYARYGKEFVPVGVCVDTDTEQVKQFLGKNGSIKWPQVYETGGFESRPAVELGVLTVPTMLLLDESGKVVNNQIHISELEDFLDKNINKVQAIKRPKPSRG